MAKANPIRFSTKYEDDESDLLYYGYRYYKASSGTWLSREPLAEKAFYQNAVRGLDRRRVRQFRSESLMPLYDFVGNNPVGNVDIDGRIGPVGVVVGVCCVVGVGVAAVYGACWEHLDGIRDQANADVSKEMKELDPNYDPNTDGPNREGSVADALRHCIGACLANQKPCSCLGRNKTQSLIQGREDYTGPKNLAHDMDRANNTVGFGIGLQSDCVKSCVDALNNGGLSCYTEGDQNLSPCKPPKKSQ